jgi:peptide/nickel transport system ATP-binding protein
MLTNPSLIIADEPSTALDVTIQAGIMDLLLELCETEDMGLILITHDLAVVSQVTEKIAVMYAGKIVETGPTEDIINNPQHPYTKGLIKAIPGTLEAGSRLNQIPGMMPTLTDIPPGCAFHPRCTIIRSVCEIESPALISVNDRNQMIACHVLGKNVS